jgi:uncharacterized protein YdaU (DUF1376 family)
MSLPYFPLYPTDYEADCAHLTLEEDGAYNRLLRLMWITPGCSVPDDAGWIARRMRVDTVTYLRLVEPIIDEFCKRVGGRIVSPRLQREWKKADETSRLRSRAGKKGGRPKVIDIAEKYQKAGLSRDEAGPKQPEPYPEPYPEIEKREAKASPKKRGTRLPDDWFLPMSWGQWAVAEGFSQDVIRIEAENFKDYWRARAGPTATKLDWEATWRVWMRKEAKKGAANGDRNHNTGRAASSGGDRFLDEIALAARARPTPGGFGH